MIQYDIQIVDALTQQRRRPTVIGWMVRGQDRGMSNMISRNMDNSTKQLDDAI
jgi:hypothetical protein